MGFIGYFIVNPKIQFSEGEFMVRKNRVIVREIEWQTPTLEKHKDLIIFFNDWLGVNYGKVMTWMEVGQHSETDFDFYFSTKKVDKKRAEEFLELYCRSYHCEKEEYQIREKFDYDLFMKNAEYMKNLRGGKL
jgi:hypothetical protein